MQLSAHDIAEATGGAIMMPADPIYRTVRGISWDSRAVERDDLYIALEGERVDGHAFCGHAVRAGSACALVQKPLGPDAIDAARIGGAAVIRVPDVMRAVRDLAARWRGRLDGKVIALTGSSGKTSTKNMVRDVLSAAMEVCATEGNQNNELGVPATLLRAGEHTPAVVVEMGMRGLHQLEDLCSFVKPDLALVTNVGTSHMELLGSRDNIARAKAEVLAAVPGTGCVFVNSSDDFARELVEYGRVREHGAELICYDGSGADPLDYPADLCPTVFAADVELDAEGFPSFMLCTPAGKALVKLALRGAHSVHNAVAAAAVACTFGLQPDLIAQALAGSRASSGRQDVITAPSGVVVVDDAYNANPDSMRASLAMFSSMRLDGLRIAVLGDMGELGTLSPAAHREVGAQAAGASLDRLICVGELARGIAAGARAAGMPASAVLEVPDAHAALAALEGALSAGDGVLVKASHSMHLEQVVEGLTASC